MMTFEQAIFAVVVLFAVLVAARSAWSKKSTARASLTAGAVALVVPFLVLLYLGHNLAVVMQGALLMIAVGSAVLVIVLRRFMDLRRRQKVRK
jgi:hypothetical protein